MWIWRFENELSFIWQCVITALLIGVYARITYLFIFSIQTYMFELMIPKILNITSLHSIFVYIRITSALENEERADNERFLEECVQDPTLRDKISILGRTFKNRRVVSCFSKHGWKSRLFLNSGFLRLTFHRKSASKCWFLQIIIAFLI